MTAYAIGDIHGCSKTFRKLLTEEIRLEKTDEVYCIGDYVDRGPDSRGVVDFIFELRNAGYSIHALRGNHEAMMLDSVKNDQSFNFWLRNGGNTTLHSFQINSVSEMAEDYLKFFNETKFYIETEKIFLVHAGLNFSLKNPLKDETSMLWIRDFEVDKNKLKGKILVHGHTPLPSYAITSQPFDSPFNIDGGCVYRDTEGMGNLFAVNLNEGKLISAKNID